MKDGTHIPGLATVADDARAGRSLGRAPQPLSTRRRPSPWHPGHLGAGVHLAAQHRFSAIAGDRQGPGRFSRPIALAAGLVPPRGRAGRRPAL